MIQGLPNGGNWTIADLYQKNFRREVTTMTFEIQDTLIPDLTCTQASYFTCGLSVCCSGSNSGGCTTNFDVLEVTGGF